MIGILNSSVVRSSEPLGQLARISVSVDSVMFDHHPVGEDQDSLGKLRDLNLLRTEEDHTSTGLGMISKEIMDLCSTLEVDSACWLLYDKEGRRNCEA